MPLKTYLRRHVYQWHRFTSLLIAVPLLLWTISGFLHPVMGLVKPQVQNSHLPAGLLDTATLRVPPAAALKGAGINSLQNVRIVKLYKEHYYQVWQEGFDSLTYINCASGRVLVNGDKRYAGYLAQRYMFEKNKEEPTQDVHRHAGINQRSGFGFTGIASRSFSQTPAAEKSRMVSITLVTSFTQNYQRSNKIRPVYEAAFDRDDGIRLYIDPKSDRLVLATDQNKRWFTQFFGMAHRWRFLEGLGKTKTVVLGSFSALCFLSSLFGFAVYNVLNRKRKIPSASRRWHRWLGNVFLLTTLLYAFSGAWHAFAKLPADPEPAVEKARISTAQLAQGFSQALALLPAAEGLTNISLAKMGKETYWQLSVKKGQTTSKKYVSITTGKLLPDGDKKYAAFLAAAIKGAAPSAVTATHHLTAFTHHYNMMNKRLPVVEVCFKDGERYYIETATSSLAAVSKPQNKAERFSFRNLHMHHYWEMWLGKESGKTVKTIFLIGTTLGLLMLALTGMIIYCRKKF